MIRTKKIVSLDFLGDFLSLESCWYLITSLFPMLSALEVVDSHLPSPVAHQLTSSCRLCGDDKTVPTRVVLDHQHVLRIGFASHETLPCILRQQQQSYLSSDPLLPFSCSSTTATSHRSCLSHPPKSLHPSCVRPSSPTDLDLKRRVRLDARDGLQAISSTQTFPIQSST